LGIPATGNEIECSGMLISHFKNGKVVEQREDFDMLGLMMQLGMELKPKEEEK
jgi:predicted ester cyclase